MIQSGLDGKVVLITGAQNPRGIGAAAARAFAGQGARVFLTGYREQASHSASEMRDAIDAGIGGDVLYAALMQRPISSLVEELLAVGCTAAALEADLSKVASVSSLLDACEDALGPVDVLVLNHAVCILDGFDPDLVGDTPSAEIRPTQVQPLSADSIDRHYEVNTRASALLMAEYVRRLVQHDAGWGRIINVTSGTSSCYPTYASYVASKYAIESYSRTAACEVGKYGITVNVVGPGPFQTGYIKPEEESAISRRTPLGRVGQPDDVADVILFLASVQARWLTGQVIYAGGGWDMPR